MVREIKYDHTFQAQEHFRQILSAMARPGEMPILTSDIAPIEDFNKASAIIGLSLLNHDVSFWVGGVPQIQQYFMLNTGSQPTSAAQADFLFLKGHQAAGKHIQVARIGEPEYPETGAFIIIDSTHISDTPIENSIELLLQGPGVKGQRKAYVEGVHATVLDQLLQKNEEYPLGVDTIFTDRNGKVLCLPRTNQFQYK